MSFDTSRGISIGRCDVAQLLAEQHSRSLGVRPVALDASMRMNAVHLDLYALRNSRTPWRAGSTPRCLGLRETQVLHALAERVGGPGEHDHPGLMGAVDELPSSSMRGHLLAVDLEPAGVSERIRAPGPRVVLTALVDVALETLFVVKSGHSSTTSGGCIARCIAPIRRS